MLKRPLVDPVLFAVAVAWGSTYLVTQDLLPHAADAPALLTVRMSLAVAAMLLVTGWKRRVPTRPELLAGLLTGLVLTAVFACETYGVTMTTATNAGVLISLTMVLTPLLDCAVSRRRPSRAFVVLVLVAVLGDVLLATGGHVVHPRPGDWLILGAAGLRAVHVTALGVLQRRRVLDPGVLTTVQMGVVAAGFLVLCLLVDAPVATYVGGLDAGGLTLLLYLALVCTVLPFFAQTWAVARTSPSRVSLLLGTEPVWAALIGVGVAGDAIGPVGLVGIVVTVLATLAARRLSDPRPAAGGAAPRRRPVSVA